MSNDDLAFEKIRQSIKQIDGRYEVELPFVSPMPDSVRDKTSPPEHRHK
jgi:hypothetical protein